MKIKILAISMIVALSGNAAQAADCGEMPSDTPSVPNGSAAGADDIRTARLSVVAFSNKVDAFLTCMDQRASRILPYLTKEQKARWEEDLANLHEKRRELQTEMNLAIREFRKASR